jgi:Electron transfer DM13
VNTLIFSSLLRRKWTLIAVALPILAAAWWAFRPEKLWINKTVSESAPFAISGDPQPLYTGRLEGKAHQTSGRATIYKAPDGGQYLRLTDFSTSNGPDVHVLLAQGDDQNLNQRLVKGQLSSLELGTLKGNQGDQNYDLPGSVDLQKYDAVVIYCERFHAVFGVAKLEQF